MATWRGGEPQAIGDVLARYLRTTGLHNKLRSPAVYDCWPEVAGAEASRHSRVAGFSNCVLYVEVDSAPWLQMLSTFRKRELLSGLQMLLSGATVKDIQFRIGGSAESWATPSERNPCPKNRPPTTQPTSRSCPA